jgi:hypothetical protein
LKFSRLLDGSHVVTLEFPGGRIGRVIGTRREDVWKEADYWRRWAVLERLRVHVNFKKGGLDNGP